MYHKADIRTKLNISCIIIWKN